MTVKELKAWLNEVADEETEVVASPNHEPDVKYTITVQFTPPLKGAGQVVIVFGA